MQTTPSESKDRRELVFAFVAPLGVDRELVEDCLRTALCSVDYSVEKISVSSQIEEFVTAPSENASPYLARKKRLMDAGDLMRRKFQSHFPQGGPSRGDAVALAAVTQLRKRRAEINKGREARPSQAALHLPDSPETNNTNSKQNTHQEEGQQPLQSTAFLIDSLKHPDEIRLLKRIYGPAFISISIYAPPEMRREFLVTQSDPNSHKTGDTIDTLMNRDESGEDESGKRISLGQDVAEAFYTTDFILDSTKQKHEVIEQLTRLIELIFGNLYLTPSRDEMGMFIARASQVRSGSMARQVGAAIMRDDGSLVAVGTNETARPISGGQYWFEDDHIYHGRDMVYQPRDTSDEFREEMVRDALERLDIAGALSTTYSVYSTSETDGSRVEKADAQALRDSRIKQLYYLDQGVLRKALLRDNIDYVRAVHAEAAAIISAACHGVRTLGTRMLTTAFPCHECARHIVAAGIKEVVYLAPYPKSAVKRLYKDSILVDPSQPNTEKVIFRTFVGVAPTRYLEFFSVVVDRKEKERGTRIRFDFRTRPPALPYYTPSARAAMSNELLELKPFTDFLAEHQAALAASNASASSGGSHEEG